MMAEDVHVGLGELGLGTRQAPVEMLTKCFIKAVVHPAKQKATRSRMANSVHARAMNWRWASSAAGSGGLLPIRLRNDRAAKQPRGVAWQGRGNIWRRNPPSPSFCDEASGAEGEQQWIVAAPEMHGGSCDG